MNKIISLIGELIVLMGLSICTIGMMMTVDQESRKRIAQRFVEAGKASQDFLNS